MGGEKRIVLEEGKERTEEMVEDIGKVEEGSEEDEEVEEEEWKMEDEKGIEEKRIGRGEE